VAGARQVIRFSPRLIDFREQIEWSGENVITAPRQAIRNGEN
jgi:hypothetical protein